MNNCFNSASPFVAEGHDDIGFLYRLEETPDCFVLHRRDERGRRPWDETLATPIILTKTKVKDEK